MKNKGFKVTAIILTLVAMIVTHPFLRVNAMEINNRPIVMERIQNITNSSGLLIFDGSQISYNYSISNAQSTTLQGATILNQPVIYICDLVINLTEPVSAALIKIDFNTASTINYPLNFIVEHGRVTSSNYNTMTVQALDTNIVYIKLIFSLQQIHDNYSYPIQGTPLDPYENDWVQYGYQYFQINSATMSSATQYQGEYIPKLNSILASVDGIEGLLQTIVTNSSDIDTNIQSINNIISGISNKLDAIDEIEWLDMPAPTGVYVGYTTDFNSYDTTVGYKDGGYFVWQSFRANDTNNYGIYKIRIPLGGFPYVFSDFKFYTRYNGNLNEWDISQYIIHINRDSFVLYFTLNNNYHNWPNGNNTFLIKTSKRFYKYTEDNSEFKYILPDNKSYWTVYNTIIQFQQFNNANNSLSRIIQILENMNINVTNQDVTNIVNNYDINIDQIFNVENNINTQLQQEMQNFIPDNTGILQRLNDSSILLKSVINQINGIEIFTIPIAVTLVGIVLLAIVG